MDQHRIMKFTHNPLIPLALDQSGKWSFISTAKGEVTKKLEVKYRTMFYFFTFLTFFYCPDHFRPLAQPKHTLSPNIFKVHHCKILYSSIKVQNQIIRNLGFVSHQLPY